MSTFRLSAILNNAVSGVEQAFANIASAVEGAVSAVLKAGGPAFGEMLAQDEALAKQYASNALAWADSELVSHQQAIAMAVEQQLDTELALVTKGASVPFNKFTNEGVDQFVATAVAAAHNWGLSVKATLALPAPIPAPQPQSPPPQPG